MQISALPEMTQTLLPLRALFHHQTRLITGLSAPYFCVIGGTMPFIRRYSTSCP